MGFQRIFLGVLFFFDFRINGFDIIPDFIGYILIYSGLKVILEMNGNFESASKLALPLIFLSFGDLFQINTSVQPFFLLIGLVYLVLNLLMVYRICKGISECAGEKGDNELAEISMKRWTLYLVNNILLMASMLLIPLAALLFLPLLVFSVVTYLLFLGLLKKAEARLEGG